MNDSKEIFEYELIDITFGYDIPEEQCTFVSEDIYTSKPVLETEEPISQEIKYDADGVPMGTSMEEIKIRRQIIHDYIQKWRSEHEDNPRVFNESIKEYIKINQVFMLESVNHAVGNYRSTKAVMCFDEVMAKAKSIGITKTKEGNSNQKPFQQMIIMHYKSDDLGNIKMTVGVRKVTKEKVGYSITVPPPGTPFIDESLKKGRKGKSKNPKKRSR